MGDAMLAVTGLVKRYGALAAVDGLSFAVRPGEVFGLLGPNGAGKTTTIRMICGELRRDGGTILLHGTAVEAGRTDRVRVGLCPQEIVVWDKLTCFEQLRFLGEMYGLPGRVATARGERLLADLGLADRARSLAGTLSGGMRRRLNIALALVHDPELVVLDEPGAGLDPQSRVRVREFIRSLAQHRTVLLTTHEMDEAARVCDQVAIIDRGRLLACASPAELTGGDDVRHLARARAATPSLEDVFLSLTGRALRQ
ncbi:MAG: ABC transporter ATP-binding protein [Dactylosporangium sp.]|nr:ABC transporter ATP-binding protein [Dactylosporangium sp.]NNJ60454.1 ABC transporter ATP-binding protein [Dactylosporangium sp.]